MANQTRIKRCDHVQLIEGKHERCTNDNAKPARGGHFCPSHIQGKEITYAVNRKRFQPKPKQP